MYYSSVGATFAESPRNRRISTFMKTKQGILYLAYTFCERSIRVKYLYHEYNDNRSKSLYNFSIIKA